MDKLNQLQEVIKTVKNEAVDIKSTQLQDSIETYGTLLMGWDKSNRYFVQSQKHKIKGTGTTIAAAFADFDDSMKSVK